MATTTDQTSSASPAGGSALPVTLLRTALLVVLMAGLYLARDLLLPLVLALLISLMLAPLMQRLQLWGWPKTLAALAPVVLLTTVLGGSAALLGDSLVDWLKHSSQGIDLVLERTAPVQEQLQDVSDSTDALDQKVSAAVPSGSEPTVVVRQGDWRQDLLQYAGQSMATLGLALCLAYFLLRSGSSLFLNSLRQVHSRATRRRLVAIVREARNSVARYLGVVLLMNILVGVLAGLALWAVGAPEPWVWGVIAGLLRFVPYLGVLVATVVLAAVAAVAQDGGLLWLLPPVGYWLTTVMTGMFLEPHIHGYRMAVNPAVILLAIVLWGWLWGVPGVLLAVPLLTVVLVVAKHLPPLQPLARAIRN